MQAVLSRRLNSTRDLSAYNKALKLHVYRYAHSKGSERYQLQDTRYANCIQIKGTAHVGQNQNDIQPMQKDTYKGAKK